MLKRDIQETIKEVLELGSLKETDKWIEDLVKVVDAVGEKLEERPENEASDKATIGKLVLDKRFIKGRPIRNPKTGESLGISEDKYTIKAKVK